ncbi:T9SS type A sorting domain-containing protein [Hyphobacterium sp. CCMP332]|nr:T9SS type A sorting domain-containing protein [Hyphobacterium sp. CCMP332]
MIRQYLFLLFAFIFSNSTVKAQVNPFSKDIPKTPSGVHRCYTEQIAHSLYEQNPTFRNTVDYEVFNQSRNSGAIIARLFGDSVIRIPTVVHVIHNNGSENISKAQIESQIRILNEDFRRISGTNGFGPGVDTKFEFFLARKDENGQCTDGIVRVQSSNTNNGSDAAIKSTSPNWDPNKYLNIYVVNSLSGGTLGYAYLPASILSQPNLDGVVIADQYFGDQGTSGSGSYGFGRTTTHEVGHWLGLRHTFNGSCTGMTDSNCFSNATNPGSAGDGVCDTPPVNQPNFTCNTNANSCAENISILGGDANDMVQNYMDYTNDLCMDRYTQGQKDRMIAQVTQYRPLLLDSMNAVSAGYYGCPVTAAISGSDTVCVGEDATITFNLTGNPPFDIVFTDGSNNFTITGASNPHTEVITAAQGTFTYTIVSVTDQDSTKTAPDPSLSGSAEITALFTGANDATLSGTGSICEGDTSIINFSANGGTSPFDIEINNGVGSILGVANNSDILVTPSDTSTFTLLNVSDANGCMTTVFSSTASFNVTQSPNSFFLKSINKGIVTFNNSTSGASSYLWDFGDGNTSTQQNPVHAYLTTGQFTVSLTSTNNQSCSNTYSEIITISEISSIRGLLAGESFELYPNPVENQVQFRIQLNSEQNIKIEIYNVSSEQVAIQNSNVKAAEHNYLFKLEHFPSGIYIFKLSTEDGRVLNSKIYKK